MSSNHLELKVLDLLEEFENKIENATSVPLTGKIMADREELLEILREIHILLPEEYQHVKWIKSQKNQILEEAQRSADALIANAQREERRVFETMRAEEERLLDETELKRKLMVDEHEIVRQAREKADKIVQEATQFSTGMKEDAFEYVHDMMSKATSDVGSVLETLRKNLRELEEYK